MFLRTLLELRRTLAFRLTSRLAAVFAGCTIVLFVACYALLWHFESNRIDDELDEDAREIGEALERKGIEGAIEAVETEARSEGVQQIYFEIYDTAGNLIFKTDATAWKNLAFPPPGPMDEKNHPIYVTAGIPPQGDQARVHITIFPSGVKLVSAYRLNDLKRLLRLASAFFGAATSAITLLAIFLGWRVTRKAMEGVEKVKATARTIANGRLDARVDISGWGTEIEQLALTFNEMIARISQLMRELSEMGDNIAHDLRTPVMRVRASADSFLAAASPGEEAQAMAVGIIEECERLLGFINTRLDISEIESGITSNHFEPMNLALLLRDIAELYQPAAEDKGLGIVVQAASEVSFFGERGKIQRLAANLLDNAVKYSSTGGNIVVGAAQVNGTISLFVRDQGVGIAPECLPHVFERYYRSDSSRSVPGNGLGLAYVHAVVRAWGGTVNIESQPNEGTTVTVTLPERIAAPPSGFSPNIAKR